MTFPREDDGKGWAWGLRAEAPRELWERFSPAYEAQAQAVLAAISALGYEARLDFAGSEDGECALGRDAAGDIAIYVPLEDPVEARLLAQVFAAGAQDGLKQHLEALK